MGMFDEIKCEYPLPGIGVPKHTFQTKDLDCAMDWFTITAAGRLVHHYREWETTPENRNLPEGQRPTLPLFQIKEGSEKMVDRNYHGYLRFYGDDGDFMAKFTDGTLTMVDDRP